MQRRRVFSMDHRIEGLPFYTLLLLPSSPFNRGQLKFPPVGSSFRPSRRFVLYRNLCILVGIQIPVFGTGWRRVYHRTSYKSTNLQIYMLSANDTDYNHLHCIQFYPASNPAVSQASCLFFFPAFFPSGGSVGRGKPQGTVTDVGITTERQPKPDRHQVIRFKLNSLGSPDGWR
jgi:hypothetical protein